jgi:hypothetical protein
MSKIIEHEINDFISDVHIEMYRAALENYSSEHNAGAANNENKYRDASGVWLNDGIKFNDNLRTKISEIINIPTSHFERTHLVRYKSGQQYKPHLDCGVTKNNDRIFTALLYLNDDFTGGETEFLNLNLKITPRKNKLIIWRNVSDDGQVLADSLHAGLPVIDGIKDILVIWIHMQPYITN